LLFETWRVKYLAKQTIRILSDATMDLPKELVEEYNIGILPTQIIIEDREKPYRNYIDITPEEFFMKLKSCKEIPTTSVPRQGDIFKIYEESLKEFDSLIVFGHSSKISSSYALAKKVAEQMFPESDITVIDSQTITIMEGLLVYKAAKMAKSGADKEEIITAIEELIPHTHGIAMLQSLEHLRKGGRISIAKHLIAKMADFKPIVAVLDGLVQNIGKVRGFDKGMALLKKSIPEILPTLKMDCLFILHAEMPQEARQLKEFILNQKEHVPREVEIFMLGPVLGTHLGPNVVGMGWIGGWNDNWFNGK
jgi:DegV family protein with EDD domain